LLLVIGGCTPPNIDKDKTTNPQPLQSNTTITNPTLKTQTIGANTQFRIQNTTGGIIFIADHQGNVFVPSGNINTTQDVQLKGKIDFGENICIFKNATGIYINNNATGVTCP